MEEHFNIHSLDARDRLLRITIIPKQKIKIFQEKLPSKQAVALH
jgi:hypothetical protein